MSIRLSEKHGVNPMLVTCFWCGKDRGDIALLGKLRNDAEAPRSGVIDYEPCDECKEGMARGITFMEASEHPLREDHPATQEGVYPTGSYTVVKEEVVRKLITPPDMLDDVLKLRKCFLDVEIYTALFGGE